jgi:ribosomal protein L13E
MLAADDNPRRWPDALAQAKTSLRTMAAAEKVAAAIDKFDLAAQLQHQHDAVAALLGRMTDLAACTRAFSLESIEKVLDDARQHATACIISSSTDSMLVLAEKRTTKLHGELHAQHEDVAALMQRMQQLAACTTSFSLHAINKLLLDVRGHSIACLIFASRNTELIRAMLLAAQPDLPLPQPAPKGSCPQGERNSTQALANQLQSVLNQLLLSSFTCMRISQLEWMQAVLDAGFNAAALKAAGVSMQQLKCAGFTAQQLKNVGDGLHSLITARYSAAELKGAGITAAHCLEIGCSAMQLKFLQFSAAELKDAGYDLPSLVAAGYSAKELLAAEFKAAHCKSAGCTAQQLRVAEFTASELKAVGYDLPSLVSGGYSLPELKSAKFTASQCKKEGFSAQQLKEAQFTVAELKVAGCSVQQLRDALFSAAELKAAGCDLMSLVAANFEAIALVHAGFSQEELAAAGVFVRCAVPRAQCILSVVMMHSALNNALCIK